MTITIQLEAEIKEVMNDYWKAYFDGDLEHWGNYLVDDYRNIGGTEEEIWNSKTEIVDYTKRIINQMQEATELRNKQTQIIPYDPYLMVHELLDIFIKVDKEWTFYQKFRHSSLIQKTPDGWKVLHQHGSYPDSKTAEGEAFAFDTLQNENLKLQKAIEARTIELEQKNRDLELEASLEKVRSVALSMRKPDDMLEVCRVISNQLQQLNVKEIRNVQTAIIYEAKGLYMNYEYYAKHDKNLITEVNFSDHPLQFEFAYQMLKGPEEFFEKNLNGLEVKEWYEYQKTTNQFSDSYLETAPSLNYYFYSMGSVALGMSTYKALNAEEIILFKRFRNVFDLAYQRFADIKQAESQAREGQIELALEKVRSKAMAMQNSSELAVIVDTVFRELTKLHVLLDRCIIMVYDPKTFGSTWWLANPEPEKAPVGLFVKYHKYKPYLDYISAWKARTLKWEYLLEGSNKKEWDEFIFAETELSRLPARVIAGMKSFDRIFLNVSFNNFGSLTVSSVEPIPEEQFDILLRFAKVFDSTYTRFNDLKQAEAQAKEARIEAALEKVRSRSLAMHHSTELEQVAGSLFDRLVELGLSFDGAFIFIFDKETRNISLWIATNHLSAPVKIDLPYDKGVENNKIIKDLWHAIENGEHIINRSYSGAMKNEYFRYVAKYNESKIPESVRQLQIDKESWTAHMVAEKNSMIGFDSWSGQTTNEEDFKILIRFAKVFEQAFTRFLDLQKAEAQAEQARFHLIQIEAEKLKAETALIELKATQKQLIQSEKMASLGELTAGIAHEIQNPLNFVNNFSEVSLELIEEVKSEKLKAQSERDKQLETELLDDIAQNLQKIAHHGKRADSIVKGMLQHSRTSTGEKQPTNLNMLADEFLKLSYHGLRAKDKSFNTELVTNFDESLPKIDVVQQDIGRVLLNLFNNAFYAVQEKNKEQRIKNKETTFKPRVEVSTKLFVPPSREGGIIVIVRDNGNGIPDAIREKIMQPFFTTKPTGEGTGLGLSLSYDIVKAHGGEIKVETKEGEYTEFSIIIPSKPILIA